MLNNKEKEKNQFNSIKKHIVEVVNSKSFFIAWIETVNEKKELLGPNWRKAEAFTSLIKGCEDNIIKEVGKKLGLKAYSRDYYSIDSILYSDGDLVPGIPDNSFWFRQIKVAFEHENDFDSGLYKEVSHLLITNSELKVLVTYPTGKDDQKENDQKDYLYKIISETKMQKELSDKESFLLIFGYENNFQWQGFVYNEANWKKIII